MPSQYKFIRFDLYVTSDKNAENFGGHVFLRAADITAVFDPLASVDLDPDKRPLSHIICAGERYIVRHPVAQVLNTIASLLDPQPSAEQVAAQVASAPKDAGK